ncbi:MAG: hypothetical protein Q7R52_02835 [archaeon]|nr:hypothetical protein [archaeon]
MVTTVDIRSGSLGGISSGSIGILEQPIAIHGTVDIQSDITIGTVNIAGTLTTNINSGSVGIIAGSIGQINSVGSITTLSNFLAGGTIQNLNRLETAGTLSEIYRLGSVGNLGTLTTLSTVTTVTAVSSLTSGSVGILGGTLGISSGSITTVSNVFTVGTIQNLNRIETAGTLAEVYRLGSVGNLGTLTTVSTVTTVTSVSSLTSGSVGILGGTLGISSGSITQVDNLSAIGTISQINNISTIGSITNLSSINTINHLGTIGEMPSAAGSATQPGGRVQVETASTILFAPNSTRLYAAMQLESVIGGADGTVYLRFGDNANGSGIRIQRGEIYEVNQLNLWRGTITGAGRSSSGGGTYNVNVVEWSK